MILLLLQMAICHLNGVAKVNSCLMEQIRPMTGKEEFQQVFIGPSAEAIHEIRRQCVEEDLVGLLSAHFDKGRVDQVVGTVNQMFDDEWKSRPASDKEVSAAPALSPHPRNRHLH